MDVAMMSYNINNIEVMSQNVTILPQKAYYRKRLKMKEDNFERQTSDFTNYYMMEIMAIQDHRLKIPTSKLQHERYMTV